MIETLRAVTELVNPVFEAAQYCINRAGQARRAHTRVIAQFQEQLDRQIAPLGLEALRALAVAKGEHVIDIGCGCGQTSVDLATRVGPEGRVLGVDISAPMLDAARRADACGGLDRSRS